VPRALWGFGRGVRLDEVESRRRPVALRCGMGVGDGLTSTAGAAGQGWRCDAGRFIDLRQAGTVLAESRPEASITGLVGRR